MLIFYYYKCSKTIISILKKNYERNKGVTRSWRGVTKLIYWFYLCDQINCLLHFFCSARQRVISHGKAFVEFDGKKILCLAISFIAWRGVTRLFECEVAYFLFNLCSKTMIISFFHFLSVMRAWRDVTKLLYWLAIFHLFFVVVFFCLVCLERDKAWRGWRDLKVKF